MVTPEKYLCFFDPVYRVARALLVCLRRRKIILARMPAVP
jgi:hypothetical protein